MLFVSDLLVAQVEVVGVVLPEQAVPVGERLDVIDEQRSRDRERVLYLKDFWL